MLALPPEQNKLITVVLGFGCITAQNQLRTVRNGFRNSAESGRSQDCRQIGRGEEAAAAGGVLTSEALLSGSVLLLAII